MKVRDRRSSDRLSARDRHKAFRLAPVAVLLWSTGATPAWPADSFSQLAPMPGDIYSYATGVSADGSVVVGHSDNIGSQQQAVIWTSSGAISLGNASYASAVSSDGSVVVGGSPVGITPHAFRWTSGGGMVDLGTLGGSKSWAYGVSANGSAVVGWSVTGAGDARAFLWTAGGGMVDLGVLGGAGSAAYAASWDGAVVVGNSNYVSGNGDPHAFRWTSVGGMVDLGTLGGGVSSASGVSWDGSVVVGDSYTASSLDHAFRWTSVGGMVDLGALYNGGYSSADAVSGNGAVVVGFAQEANNSQVAFRWTQATGMQRVTQWLSDAHVTVPSGWSLSEATATNSDGSVVVGNGTNAAGYDEAWIARVSAIGSGIMSPSSYVPTLVGAGSVPRSGISLAALTLFGVHHRPLMDSGQLAGTCAWVTADAAHSDTYGVDQQVAEAGVCRDLGERKWRVGVGVGTDWSSQGLSYGGSGRYEGDYLYTEADYAPESRRWIASFSGMVGRWDTTLSRGYLNGASTDHSTGKPNASGWSVRARLDWKDAARLGAFSVSPFVAATHTASHLDAYTETGGGFPARFDAQDWSSDEVRLGTVLKRSLSAVTDLRLDLEAANRLDGSGPGISGTVLGLFSFSYGGADVRRTWARAMLEVDHRLSRQSLLSANINAASEGEDATWGMSVGYKRTF